MLVKSNYLPIDFDWIQNLRDSDVIMMVQRATIQHMTSKIAKKAKQAVESGTGHATLEPD
jgi:hypothetical protein